MVYQTQQWLKTGFLIIAFFTAQLLFARNESNLNSNPWRPIAETSFAKKSMERTLVPKAYQTFKLNLPALQEVLQTAPLRFSAAADLENVIIRLPMPNGELEQFQIFAAPIMEAGLAEKFPMIKSYAGIGMNDPTASVRMDVTQFGLHAMIMSDRHSTVFIDPYSRQDTEHYLTYYKKDYEEESDFECHVKGEGDSQLMEMETEAENENSLLAGDCVLRTYRLAITCTGEYAAFHGGTVAGVMAAMNTTMVRVNGVYEREVNVNMVIVDGNDTLIFLDAATDPYNDGSPGQMIGECHDQCEEKIGSANYDIGHIFSTQGGGLAGFGVVCSATRKGNGVTGTNSPQGDPFDIDYVAHEIGHQFGGSHSYNNSCSGNRSDNNAMEPGSGSTIMAYAGICNPNVQFASDDYFHAISIQQISNYINSGNGNSCAVFTNTGNNAPTVEGGNDYVLPVGTPFKLTAVGADADADPISYCWEQMDNEISTQPPTGQNTSGPSFRTYDPREDEFRYFPKLTDVINGINDEWEVLPEVGRNMSFRVTVRDNHMGSGCTAEDDVNLTFANEAGPFLVQAPNTELTWIGGTMETVTWDVANTDAAPVSCANVNILLSTDGGLTYPTTLASEVPNTGSFDVLVPEDASTTCRVMVVCADNIFYDISNEDFTIEIATNPIFVMSASPMLQDVCGTVGAVTYSLDLTGLAGFNENVTLTTTGEPADAALSFSQNNFVPSGISNLTLGNLENVVDGTYNIIVTATSTSITIEQAVTLIISNSLPDQIVLSGPTDGAATQSVSPTLTWAAVDNANTYVVEISTSPAFGNNIVETATVVENNFTSNGLSPLTVYYWRVRGTNNCGENDATTWFSFQTESSTCTSFTSTDTPITIAGNSVNTISSDLSIGNSLNIISVQPTMEINHTWVGDLSAILIAPSGTQLDLFDQPGVPSSQYGCRENNLLLTFDDNATNTAADLEGTCEDAGGYAINGTYQPLNSLAILAGEDAMGNWELEVSDAVDEDGGSLQSWALEICYSQEVGSMANLNNFLLTVAPSATETVANFYLAASSPTATAEQITFVVLSLPTNGTLQINGMAAIIGSTFTQADIDNNTLTYTNTNPDVAADSFNFDVITEDGSWIQNQTFNINIGAVAISANATTGQQVSCNDGNDGIIVVNATGINPPFEYSLDGTDFQESNTFENLAAGTYTFIVRDNNGEELTTNPVTLTNPTALSGESTVDANTVTLSAAGGTGTLMYNVNGSNFQVGNVFSNLPNGDYTFGIMDENGCQITIMSTINIIESAVATTTAVSCVNGDDGTITVSEVVGGTAPYLYSLDNNNFVSNNIFTSLLAGGYTVYVMDATGYSFTVGSFQVNNAATLSVTALEDLNTITATGLGGNGTLTYSINGGDFQDSNVFTDLENGVYVVTVMDENGCIATSIEITINVTASKELDFDLNFSLFPSPNDGQFTIDLNQPTEQNITLRIFDVTGKLVSEIDFEKNTKQLQSTINVSYLPAGSYEVLLTDGKMFGRKRFVKM